uniref:Uncharacterized protein n=1 Tax=viral metagenome TaxID=1070528 RepID=A0A6C0CFW9_9ZZZZ
MDIKFTVQILVLAIVAYLIITAGDEVLDRVIFKWLGLDREQISSWVIVLVIGIVLMFVLLYVFNIEAHDILGVGEAVDVQLTGQTESFKRGRIVHDTRYYR